MLFILTNKRCKEHLKATLQSGKGQDRNIFIWLGPGLPSSNVIVIPTLRWNTITARHSPQSVSTAKPYVSVVNDRP